MLTPSPPFAASLPRVEIPPPPVRFDRYVLASDRLTHDGSTIHLAAKPLGVLRVLVDNAGRLTTKQTLVEAVWRGRAVSDESIARSVFLVRQALGDVDNRPARFIETVYGRGYRFVAPVSTAGTVAVTAGAPRPLLRVPAAASDRERAAFNLCLEARYRLSRWAGDPLAAVSLFERALDLEPSFAPARIGLAECSLWLAMHGLLAPLTAAARARAQLGPVLAATPGDPRACAVLGLLSSFFDWDPVAADHAFDLALAADPGDPVAQAFAGRHRTSTCDWPGARAAMDAALALEPGNLVLRNARAFYAACAGEVGFALTELETSIALEPRHPQPNFYYALVAAGAGDGSAAYRVAGQLRAYADEVPMLRAILGFAAACVGDEQELRQSLDFLAAAARTRYVVPTAVAFIHARRGDHDAAFRWLDRAIEERCAWLALAHALPGLAPLRGDRRFGRITAAIGRGG